MEQGRLFKIVYHLLDKGRATAPELAEKFEVSVRTIYRDLDAISAAGIPIYTVQGKGGGMLGQGGGCHPLAAQKIRRCPLCCLHQRQQQMAGIRLAAPLLPRQHQRRVHGACRREGKTFISVDPEHLQILL